MSRSRKRKSTAPQSKASIRAKRLIEAAKVAAQDFDNPLLGEMYVYGIEQKVLHDNPAFLEFIKEFEQIPVDIETFLDHPNFMGATDLELWPEVRKAIIGINKYWWKGEGGANKEAVLMGATGTGKTEISKVTTCYHAHILGCMKQPQKIYGLPGATSIVFVIQSAKPHVTKKIIYMPTRTYIEAMPWFQTYMRPNRLVESEMYFEEKNIRIVPGGSDADAVLGEALIGGVLDEVNFMNVVNKSKKAEVTTGRAGVYDQAQNIYDTVTRRKKSRFISRGPTVGVVVVSSSTRYKGDFTDKRKEYVEQYKERGVYVYEKAQFEVWPQKRYCGDKFRIVVENDASMDIRIVEDMAEEVGDCANQFEVPIEYLDDFKKDPSGALRDIVGRSVNSINPFFRTRYKIAEAIQLGIEQGVESFLVNSHTILGIEGMPMVERHHYCKNPSKPRFIHVDLSKNGDRCGIAMVRFDGMLEMKRRGGEVEYLPKCTVEMAATVEPDHNDEIHPAEVRTWIRQLKTVYGYPIKAVTYDGWNSLESQQAWRKAGVPSGLVSVDKTDVPYKNFRDALYDGRVALINDPVLEEEIYNLEYDEKTAKVDHPVKGSKDCVDAVCGAFTTMIRRAATWKLSDEDGASERYDPGERHDAGRA